MLIILIEHQQKVFWDLLLAWPRLGSTHVMLQRGGLGLAQPVDVEDDHQVVQLVVAGEVQRLPDAALGRFAVAHEAVHPADNI